VGADPRFYERLGPLTAGELADRIGAELFGDAGLAIFDVNTPDCAGAGELFFLARNAQPPAAADGACAIVASHQIAESLSGAATALIARDPRAAFGRACAALLSVREHDGDAFLHPAAQIDPTARLGPGVAVGQGAEIGAGTVIGPGAVIGPGVIIGRSCVIGARVVVRCAVLGDEVEMLSGAVIGEAGFGLAQDQGGLLTIPHVGRVMIGDQVTIGANSTVDRGMIRDTVLQKACKIDNLCHIAHNCEIGEYAVMAAFSGVSGSVKVGRGAQFGGRAGVADHLRIGDGARLAAFAGVMKDVPDGETWAGSPAQPIQRFMRETVWIRRQAAGKGRGKAGRDES
jgi:UDP-3-O-[3-hydroxymyristoyl] glucosamine N-acyltransferase